MFLDPVSRKAIGTDRVRGEQVPIQVHNQAQIGQVLPVLTLATITDWIGGPKPGLEHNRPVAIVRL